MRKKLTAMKDNAKGMQAKLSAMEETSKGMQEKLTTTQKETKEDIWENVTQVVEKIAETYTETDALECKVLNKQQQDLKPIIRSYDRCVNVKYSVPAAR